MHYMFIPIYYLSLSLSLYIYYIHRLYYCLLGDDEGFRQILKPFQTAVSWEWKGVDLKLYLQEGNPLIIETHHS